MSDKNTLNREIILNDIEKRKIELELLKSKNDFIREIKNIPPEIIINESKIKYKNPIWYIRIYKKIKSFFLKF